MAQISSNGDLRARSAGSLSNGHTIGTGGLHHSQPSWGTQQQRVELLGGVKLAGCVAGGVVFGFAAEKCRGKLFCDGGSSACLPSPVTSA